MSDPVQNHRQTIIFLGDGITGPSDLTSYIKFSDVLETMLAARFGDNAATVLNRGIAGNTASGVLDRLHTDLLDTGADIVVLLIGGNGVDPAGISREFAGGTLRKILATLLDQRVRVLILQYHVLIPPDGLASAWRHIASNNALIGAIANDANVPLLNMNDAIQKARAIYSDEQLVKIHDGVHLNPAGELVYARMIFSKLMELNWLHRSDSHGH